MELLNNEERELLTKYNRYLTKDKIQEPLKYSDIFIGKHDINNIPQQTQEKKIQNSKLHIKTSSANKRDQFKSILNELNNVQNRQLENIFKSSSVCEETQREKQINECEIQVVVNENVQQKTNKNSDRPEKQSKQQKSLPKEQIKKKQEQQPKKDRQIQSLQSTVEIQQQFNEKLLQQLNKLMQLKKIDNKFFYNLISKHVNECPNFGKRVKEEIKEILNQLL
ncbi:unnamed protein product [Paramecium sonneborni]|uniref:Uncharacterized protein n=1 Tax=Paramecium sonneborni TaxID=65129 RepID=A0A8S1RA75_9CILI|nr:unnamed protein product [Paramecium sonneborni]